MTGSRGFGYARISEDQTERGAGVERQSEDVIARAEREGITLVEPVAIDNDLSGSRYATKARPGWDRLVTLAEAGAIDVVVVYDIDRLTRQPKQLEQLIDLADPKIARREKRAPLRVVTLYGDIDLTTGDGIFTARIIVAQAAKASDDTSRRVARACQQKREQGRPKWSFRPFGFELDGTHRADEAATLRSLYARFADGESLRFLAGWLNDAGITQPARTDRATGDTIAKPWTVGALSALLKADRNAGLYRSRIPELADQTTRAAWDPIVDADTFARVRRVLDTNASGVSGRVRRHLLSGLLVCDHCGGRMVALPRRNPTGSVYACRKDPRAGQHGCGRAVSMPNVDAVVSEAVIAWLEDPANRDRLAVTTDEADAGALHDVIAAAIARRRDLIASTDPALGLGVTMDDIAAELRTLAARESDARASLTKARASSPVEYLPRDGGALREDWEALGIEERRALIVEVLEPVRIRATAKAGRIFDRSRVVYTYRYPTAAAA